MADKNGPGTKSSGTVNNHLLASPPRAPVTRGNKERGNPSITPRKFKRFFTPRPRVNPKPSAARKALRELATSAVNTRSRTPLLLSPLQPISEESLGENGDNREPGELPAPKRRKIIHASPQPEVQQLLSPSKTSPIVAPTPGSQHSGLRSPMRPISWSQSTSGAASSFDIEFDGDDVSTPSSPLQAIMQPMQSSTLKRQKLGFAGQLMERMNGGLSRPGRQFMSFPVDDPSVEAADFYSAPDDRYECASHEGGQKALPFCVAACKKSGLVAVGDDEGYVRLLDSDDSDFSRVQSTWQAHGNAIIDLEISADDSLLATASGDQTGKLFDMLTRTPKTVLSNHTASLKQIRFQPGKNGNHVLATSSRDGSVQIWDTRCQGGLVKTISMTRQNSLTYGLQQEPNPGCVVNSFPNAHMRMTRQAAQQAVLAGDSLRGSDFVSVTSLQFLPPGREHLLLTACDADASIKLWDIRKIGGSSSGSSRNSKHSTPVSATAVPGNHLSFRPFGIASLVLGSDGQRLYSVCKDNTVYAYSTQHLVLGHGAGLVDGRKYHGPAQSGLGPLYGFRHQKFHASSFFIKAAIRPARDGMPEMLAVGSGDCCAMLFPTNERYLQQEWERQASLRKANAATHQGCNQPCPSTWHPSFTNCRCGSEPPPSQMSRWELQQLQNSSVEGGVPLALYGTPLVRGHNEEVGGVAWSNSGKLITLSDECVVRRWKESREKASDLRTGGETGGRRWGCGWADMGKNNSWDEDDW